MKKLSLSIISVFYYGLIYGQTITENKVDEFTKNSIIRSSWELINRGSLSSPFTNNIRVSKINNTVWLDWKMMDNEVNAISKGENFMIMLSNDSVVKLENSEHVVSCKGCGATGFVGSEAWGINTAIKLSENQIELLRKFPLKKVRIYFTDGYREFEVKEKFSRVLNNELNLVLK